MCAFHENPNRIHTAHIYSPLKRIITKCMFSASNKIFETSKTNSVAPDQTAPVGTV